MKVLSVTVDRVPDNCGICYLMRWHNNDQPMCCALPDDVNNIQGNPYDMNYRRSDCPLVAKYPVITRESDIRDLELSIRSYNCLKRHGVQTAGELADMTDEEFMTVRNLGRRSLEEIKEKLRETGLDKKEEDKKWQIHR